jgi:outer membrane lipoprotein SlyB
MSALSGVPLWVATALILTARGHDIEHRTAAGAIAGAVVAGPIGVVAGAGAGAVIDKVSN